MVRVVVAVRVCEAVALAVRVSVGVAVCEPVRDAVALAVNVLVGDAVVLAVRVSVGVAVCVRDGEAVVLPVKVLEDVAVAEGVGARPFGGGDHSKRRGHGIPEDPGGGGSSQPAGRKVLVSRIVSEHPTQERWTAFKAQKRAAEKAPK